MNELINDLPILIVIVLVLAMLGLVALGVIIGQRRSPSQAPTTDERLIGIEGRLSHIESRADKSEHKLNNIQQAMQALPTADTVHRLEVQIAALSGEMKSATTNTIATARAIERVEDYLLKGKIGT